MADNSSWRCSLTHTLSRRALRPVDTNFHDSKNGNCPGLIQYTHSAKHQTDASKEGFLMYEDERQDFCKHTLGKLRSFRSRSKASLLSFRTRARSVSSTSTAPSSVYSNDHLPAIRHQALREEFVRCTSYHASIVRPELSSCTLDSSTINRPVSPLRVHKLRTRRSVHFVDESMHECVPELMDMDANTSALNRHWSPLIPTIVQPKRPESCVNDLLELFKPIKSESSSLYSDYS